jgi:hypothetical protein
MWTVIHLVSDRDKANQIYNKLTAEGFLVKVQPLNKKDDNRYFQILVPGSEAQEAYDSLVELGLS